MSSDNRILAAYVTYKKLYVNKETDVYDIISEFIKYVILKERKTSYSQIELYNLIMDNFDFHIPSLVLKPAALRIKGVSNDGKKYIVDYSLVKANENFEQIQADAFKNNDVIMNDIIFYIENRLTKKLSDEEKEKVTNSFRRYILDESSNEEYAELISAFIIEKSKDVEYVKKLDYIREGHILYSGLSLNQHVSECGWRNKLTVYMDMEILFHLAGYNGTIFQKIVEEFLELVSEVNKDKKYITLKYFRETKQEIESFFDTAETLYRNNQLIWPGQTAMETILSGCKNVGEIDEKRSKFYYLLLKNGIYEETKSDFYTPKYEAANLESSQYSDKELKDVRLISHINKLRNNKIFEDYALAECILLSETGTVLEFSKKFISEKEAELRAASGDYDRRIVPYAVNLYALTNTLWCRLNRSLNRSGGPATINSVIRAQIVLSKYINESVVKEYENLLERQKRNDIDRDELMFTIMRLRHKSKKPENIVQEGVEDATNFLCERELDKFVEDYQGELAKHKQIEKKYTKVKGDLENLNKNVEELKKEKIYKDALYEYKDASRELEYIRERKEEYIDNFREQTNKLNRSKSIKKKVIASIYVIYYIILFVLILVLSWDDMEPITYILSILPLVYAGVSKLFDFKWNLNYWIGSYEKSREYQNAKEKADIYTNKEKEQNIILQEKQVCLNSIEVEIQH